MAEQLAENYHNTWGRKKKLELEAKGETPPQIWGDPLGHPRDAPGTPPAPGQPGWDPSPKLGVQVLIGGVQALIGGVHVLVWGVGDPP